MFHFFPNQPKLEYFFLKTPELARTNRCRSATIADLPLPACRPLYGPKELTKLVHDYSQQYRLASSENPLSLALEQRLCHGSSA
jgi:hypothetical protein